MPALLTACSQDDKSGSGIFSSDSVSFSTQEILSVGSFTITDINGAAIPNAQILIGDSVNSPFNGNILTADKAGKASAPSNWNKAETVTAWAPGYTKVTYIQQTPGAITMRLRKINATKGFEVKGNTTGLPIKDYDDQIDFGVVMPAMTKADLLNFDINAVISPEIDEISTLGQSIKIPSNISLPRQQERYSIFTATLDKPTYRAYFENAGTARLYVMKGRFEFEPVADALREDKSFFDVINSFKITGGGIRDINIQGPNTQLDLPTNELNFTDKKTMVAPQFQSDEAFIALATAKQGNLMVPTDMRRMNKGEKTDLALLPKAESQLLAVIKKKADMASNPPPSAKQMSAALIPFSANTETTPLMLAMVNAPAFGKNGELLVTAPAAVRSINPIGTYAVLSIVNEKIQAEKKIETLSQQWEIYAPAWATTIRLPNVPNQAPINGKKRWEVSFLGSQNASQAAAGPAMIQATTHVTHSSTDF